VQRLLREQGVEHVKLAGADCATGTPRDRARRPPPPPVVSKSASLLLSAVEVGALRTIAAELDACRAMLATAVGGESAEARRERAG